MTRRSWMAAPAGLLVAACSQKPAGRGEAKQRYELKGEVLRLKPGEKIAVIKHEKIGDWMEAMTMDFPVPDEKEFAKLAEGKHIRATVQVNDLYFWLTDIQAE